MGQLPSEVRKRVPSKDELRSTKLEIMRLVRQRFESRFVNMPAPPSQPTNFYFTNITLLEARDLIQLIRALGIEQLAAAFLTVGKRKLAELCHRLGRQAADELISAVKETEARDAMDLSEANNFLARVVLGLQVSPTGPGDRKERFQRELFQKAGLFRLAQAIRLERPSFVQQLAQRIPRSHGQLLRSYVFKLTEDPNQDESGLRRLQDLVLARVEKLAARGKVNPRYLKFDFCYWGEEEAEAAEEGGEEAAGGEEYQEGGEEYQEGGYDEGGYDQGGY